MILPDRFELRHILGRGGFGKVFLVYDHERQEDVAVKHLYSPVGRRRFKQEGTQHTHLRHPNLLRIHELLEHQGELFIIMEFVPGQDLIRTLRGTRAALPGSTSKVSGSASTGRTLPSYVGRSGHPQGTIRAHVNKGRKATPLSDAQLQTLSGLLQQLVEGVTALHSTARIHRDLKAENILVTPEGRLVVVDFGLTVQPQTPSEGIHRPGQGTPFYMAPENWSSTPPGPALDWYAVGVILYKLLTGYFPFIGTPRVLQMRKVYNKLVPFEARGLHYPQHWWTLTQALLHPNPRQRANGQSIQLLLTGETPRTAPQSLTTETLFGRESTLQALERRVSSASTQPQRVLILEGESGSGKSTLLTHLRPRLEQLGCQVFLGRCYERAVLPFKALDEILEAVITRVRDHTPDLLEHLSIPEQEVLHTHFPHLRPIQKPAGSPPSSPLGGESSAEASESAQQRQLFQALTQLLTAMASLAPIVFLVDDLQWGDQDSGQLLRFILQSTHAHPIVCIGMMHPRGTQVLPFLKGLEDEPAQQPQRQRQQRRKSAEQRKPEVARIEFLELPPLTLEDAGAWAEQLRPDLPLQQRTQAVLDCEGHPLFLQKLLDAKTITRTSERAQPTLSTLLQVELEQLEEVEQQILSFLALALRPLTLQELRALMPDIRNLHTHVEHLSDHKQLRSLGAVPLSLVEPYHRQQRLVVLAFTGKEKRIHLSRRLASVLESLREEPHALAIYFEDGEVWDRAFLAYRQASEQAVEARSFGQATALHARALELHARALEAGSGDLIPPLHSAELGLHHVRLLLMAGDTVAAARELQRVLEVSPGLSLNERHNMQRTAAFYLLISGHLEKGREVLRGLLTPFGLNLDRHPILKVLSVVVSLILIRVFWPFRHWRSGQKNPVHHQEYLDVCGNLSQSLGLIDPLTAAWFQGLHMRAVLRAGDPLRLLHALFMEIFCYSAGGTRFQGWVKKVYVEAEQLIDRLGEERLRGQLLLSYGKGLHHQSSWRSAIEVLEKAIPLLQAETFELRTSYDNINGLRLLSAHIYVTEAASQTGDFHRIKRIYDHIMLEAESKQYLSAQVHVLTVISPLLSLVEDRPERARESFAQGMQRWPYDETHLQHFFSDYSRIRISLYEGKVWEALRQLDHRSTQIFRRMLLIPQHMRIFRVAQRGHTLLAYTEVWKRLHRGMPRWRITARILWLELYAAVCILLLWLDGAEAAQAHAALLRGSLFFLTGHLRLAQKGLERAAHAYERADMRVAALYAHWGWTVCSAQLLERDAVKRAPQPKHPHTRNDTASPTDHHAASPVAEDSALARARLLQAHQATHQALRDQGIAHVEKFARLYLPPQALIEGPAWLHASGKP